MEEKKQIKIKLSTIIWLILIIIIIIGGIIFVKYGKYKRNVAYNLVYNMYDTKAPNGFVPPKIEECKNYQYLGGIKYSVENAEEAVDCIRTLYEQYDAKNSKLLKLELVDDEDYYYSIFKSYESNYYDVTYDHTYIFFKRDIIDIDNKQINLGKINNKDEIKNIFNTYNYVYNYENGSYKIEKSKIKEYMTKYVYTIYFYEISYGDWGLYDHIQYYKQNIVINKVDGKYTIETKKIIDEFDGKYNSGPNFDNDHGYYY